MEKYQNIYLHVITSVITISIYKNNNLNNTNSKCKAMDYGKNFIKV